MRRSYKIRSYKRIYRRSWGRRILRWLLILGIVAALFLIGWKLYEPIEAFFTREDTPPVVEEEQLSEETPPPVEEEPAPAPVPAEPEQKPEPAPEPSPEKEEEPAPAPEVSSSPASATLYITEATLHDSEAFAKALASAKAEGMDSVMVDIKDKDGWTIYPIEYLEGFDSYYRGKPLTELKTVADQIKSAGLKPVVSLYSFMDRRFPIAQTYAGILVDQSDYFWMDKSKETGGHCWPNPYSPIYIDYLKKLLSDAGEAGFEEVVLREFRFPSGLEMNRQRFVYDEGVSKLDRLKALDDEFRTYAADLGMDLRVAYPAADLLGQEELRYDGDAAQLLEDGVIVDITAVEGADLSAALSAIKGKAGTADLTGLASSEEQLSALKAAGISKYILTK